MNYLDLARRRVTRERLSEDCQRQVASDGLGSGAGLLSKGFIPKKRKEEHKEAKYKSSKFVRLLLSPCAFTSEMTPLVPVPVHRSGTCLSPSQPEAKPCLHSSLSPSCSSQSLLAPERSHPFPHFPLGRKQAFGFTPTQTGIPVPPFFCV